VCCAGRGPGVPFGSLFETPHVSHFVVWTPHRKQWMHLGVFEDGRFRRETEGVSQRGPWHGTRVERPGAAGDTGDPRPRVGGLVATSTAGSRDAPKPAHLAEAGAVESRCVRPRIAPSHPFVSRLDALTTRLKLWRVAQMGPGVRVLGDVYVHGGGRITLGRDVTIDGRGVPVELHAEPGAELVIGDGVTFEPGASVEAQTRVDIGPGCHLGRLSKVLDNHFHPVRGDRLQRPTSKPVVLEAHVSVGARAIVLPGAFLEANVTLGPGVVISRRVKAGLHLVGSPPRVERPTA